VGAARPTPVLSRRKAASFRPEFRLGERESYLNMPEIEALTAAGLHAQPHHVQSTSK
jgi:hypothetical protein